MVEFALIAPVLILLLMGVFDLAYSLYVDSMLQGSIQQAGRNSSIEGASTTAMDQIVTDAVHGIVPDATLGFNRKAYATFSDVGKPEDFTDLNSNGKCDNGEPYEDANLNGTWDSDQGVNGQGSARDAVLYTVTVTYPRPFAVAKLANLSNTVTLKTETVLRNQPYALQKVSNVTKNCP